MKRTIAKIGIISICGLLALALGLGILFFNEIRSLASLKKIDDHPMYRMTYYGDYGFDDFLEEGAKSDSDIERFVANRLLKGLPIDLGVAGGGCTAFVVQNRAGELFYGRNFDFTYTPFLQVWTTPKNGYASVSTVNLSFAGYSTEYLPRGLSFDSFLTLAAPFLPFDGMNEKGVAIALLAVPETRLPYDENKITLNTTTAIRLVLDKAADTAEAVELLKKYNIYFSAEVYCHYLIADASGSSVIVEYWDGELQTVRTTDHYQIASNFIAYGDLNIGDGFCELERYDMVKQKIEEHNGFLEEDEAIDLLRQVGVYYDGEDRLQWSVLYKLTSQEGKIFARRDGGNITSFTLR